MCILVHAVKRQSVELPLEGRISNALVEVGPSITLASLSEVLAFAVGSFIPMPACRVFSMFAGLSFYPLESPQGFLYSIFIFLIETGIVLQSPFSFSYTALAVLLDFLLQVTAFVALIVFDFLRTEDKRVDCFPCIKSSRYAGSDKGSIFTLLISCSTFLFKYVCSDLLMQFAMMPCLVEYYLGITQKNPGLLARYMKVTF